MIRLNVVDRDGIEREIEASPAGSLMEVLRELDNGVAAICGGLCSCASCHVYVAQDWGARVSRLQEAERELLAELQHYRELSRLSCQINLSRELDGLHVTLAPEE